MQLILMSSHFFKRTRLQDAGQALEAHARVHVLRGELFQAVRFAVVLDEHHVPNLDHVRVPGLDVHLPMSEYMGVNT